MAPLSEILRLRDSKHLLSSTRFPYRPNGIRVRAQTQFVRSKFVLHSSPCPTMQFVLFVFFVIPTQCGKPHRQKRKPFALMLLPSIIARLDFTNAKKRRRLTSFFFRDLCRIQTCNPHIRSVVLYSVELIGHTSFRKRVQRYCNFLTYANIYAIFFRKPIFPIRQHKTDKHAKGYNQYCPKRFCILFYLSECLRFMK